MAGLWTRTVVLAFASGFEVLVSILGPSHCYILLSFEHFDVLHLSKCQTKANQRPLPAVALPDLDLCSLITISDHLVLIPLEERTKTFEIIYIAAIAGVYSIQTPRHFHVLSTILPLSDSVTVLPEKYSARECPNDTPAQQNLPYLCQHQPLKFKQWCSAHLLQGWVPVKGQRHACRTMSTAGIMSR